MPSGGRRGAAGEQAGTPTSRHGSCHDLLGTGTGADGVEERLRQGGLLERADARVHQEAERRPPALGVLLDQLIVGRAPPEPVGQDDLQHAGIRSVSRKVMPPALSFSKLRSEWRWRVHPTASSGHPQRRWIMHHPVASRDVPQDGRSRGSQRGEQEAVERQAEGGLPDGIMAFRSLKGCRSSGALGDKQPSP